MQQNPTASLDRAFLGDRRPTTVQQTPSIARYYVIAICAAICGADDWAAVEAFGHAKRVGLRHFRNCL